MKLKLILALACCIGYSSVNAQSDISKDFGEFRVYYSVFNSSFLTPEIADLYDLTRGSNRAIINISLIKTSDDGDSLGLPARVSGSARNLIMQSTPLNFVEIDEGEATYYLASFRFDDQDPLLFDIEVTREGTRIPYKLSFSRTLYQD